MDQVQHSLSRLALAKAIKSLDDNSKEESWNKSIIFNQPFVKDLQRQRHRLSCQLEKTTENKPRVEENSRGVDHGFKRNDEHIANSPSYISSEDKKPLPLPSKNKRQLQRTCLPSDTEDDSGNEQVEDEETDDDSEIFEVNRHLTLGKNTCSPATNPNVKSPSLKMESRVSSPSRNSSSSHLTPLTEEDQVEEPNIYHNQQNIPQNVLNDQIGDHIPLRHLQKSPVASPFHPTLGVDPMYYQQYQKQLQYQQQWQYQQQLQYQQQQLYLLSQNPSVFFSPSLRATMMREEPCFIGPHLSSPHLPQLSQHIMPSSSKRRSHPQHKHRSSNHRPNSTDVRRRNEILRNSTSDLSLSSLSSPSPFSTNAYMPKTIPNSRDKRGRHPSYF